MWLAHFLACVGQPGMSDEGTKGDEKMETLVYKIYDVRDHYHVPKYDKVHWFQRLLNQLSSVVLKMQHKIFGTDRQNCLPAPEFFCAFQLPQSSIGSISAKIGALCSISGHTGDHLQENAYIPT